MLFGVGPWPGLAGRIGTSALTAIVTLGVGVQMIFSRWLGRYEYGAAEWVWQTLTYGRPSMGKP